MTTSRENHRIKYGAAHRKLREQWVPLVAMGTVHCSYPGCGRLIEPGTHWDLGHRYDDAGRPLQSMPMHRKCNRNTAHSDKERDTGTFNKGPSDKGPRTSRIWGPGS
jgi:hypothetical protein